MRWLDWLKRTSPELPEKAGRELLFLRFQEHLSFLLKQLPLPTDVRKHLKHDLSEYFEAWFRDGFPALDTFPEDEEDDDEC